MGCLTPKLSGAKLIIWHGAPGSRPPMGKSESTLRLDAPTTHWLMTRPRHGPPRCRPGFSHLIGTSSF